MAEQRHRSVFREPSGNTFSRTLRRIPIIIVMALPMPLAAQRGADVLDGYMPTHRAQPMQVSMTLQDQDGIGIAGLLAEIETEDGQSQTVMSDSSGMLKAQFYYEHVRPRVQITIDGIRHPASDGRRFLALRRYVMDNECWIDSIGGYHRAVKLQWAEADEIRLPTLMFDLSKWSLYVSDDYNGLDSLLVLKQILDDNPTIAVEFQCHTDARGSLKSNEILSQKRAEYCVQALMERGVDPDRIVAVGYGESRLLVSDEEISRMSTDQERERAHSKNRRTVFRVTRFDYVSKQSVATKPNEPLFLQVDLLNGHDSTPIADFPFLVSGASYRLIGATDTAGRILFRIAEDGTLRPDEVYLLALNGSLGKRDGVVFSDTSIILNTGWLEEGGTRVIRVILEPKRCIDEQVRLIVPQGSRKPEHHSDYESQLGHIVYLMQTFPESEFQLNAHTRRGSERRGGVLLETVLTDLEAFGMDPTRLSDGTLTLGQQSINKREKPALEYVSFTSRCAR